MVVDPADILATIAKRKSAHLHGEEAPTDAELQALLPVVRQVANHMNLDCWRMHTIRGDQRVALGHAFNEADGVESDEPSDKPLRAPLLIAVILSPKDHQLVPEWEQLACAAGAAHFLNLALWLNGWGSVWRTGRWIDTEPVCALHHLEPHERVLGWLYVGTPVWVRKEHTTKVEPERPELITPLP